MARFISSINPGIDSGVDDIAHQQNLKVFDVYNVYRVVLSLVLVIGIYFRLLSLLGTTDPALFQQTIYVYTGFNVLVLLRALLPRNRTLETSQFITVILIDIIFLVLISYTCGGVSSGMANLLIVPVASGSLLFRTRLSVFFAAVGSILVIYSEVYLYLVIDEGIVYFVQAGLLGFTLFAVTGILQYLCGNIRQNELLTRQQAENILSLQEMNDQIHSLGTHGKRIFRPQERQFHRRPQRQGWPVPDRQRRQPVP